MFLNKTAQEMRVILHVPQVVGLLLLLFLNAVSCDCDWNATIKDSQQLAQNYLQDNNCPLAPTIKILNYNMFNNSKSTNYSIFSQDNTNKTWEIPTHWGMITLECSSTQPVTWNIQGYYLKSELIKTVVLKRKSLEHYNDTVHCFKALISFDAVRGDLGYTISCKHVYEEGEGPSQKFLHFYGKRSAGVGLNDEPAYTCYTNPTQNRKSRHLSSFDNTIAGSDAAAGPERSNHLKINLQYYDDKKLFHYFECSNNSAILSTSETSSHSTSAEKNDEPGNPSVPLSVSMAVIKCSNPVHCKLETRFLDMTSKIDGDYLLYGRETNVLSIPGSYTSGVVLCRTNDKRKYQFVQFYRSVDKYKNKILLYDDHNPNSSQHSETEPSSVMEIVPPSINVTAGMPITCKLSYFPFARGSNWHLEYSNGSTLAPNILNSSETETHYTNMQSELVSNVTDNPNDIKSIICRAPLWNSDRWVSLKYEVSRPEIIDFSKPVDLYDTDTDTDITLFCKAVGSPLPHTIVWYKDGQAVENHFCHVKHNITNTSIISYLHFNRTLVNLSTIAGDYSCNAENYFGKTGRELTIKVTPNPLLKYVAYSLGSIFLVTIITLSIYLYSFWAQSIIDKKKIQELMKNFYEGIPLPAQQDNNDTSNSDIPSNNDQSADTTGTGLAFSLVYDEEKYELNPEDLEVEPENPSKQLGKGNYGIVYEGRLKTRQRLLKEPVAVKMLIERNLANVEDLLAELKLLIYANEGQHENIVKLKGAITKNCNEKIQIVMEFCEGGSLQKYLEQNRRTFYDEFKRIPSDSQNTPGPIPPYVTIGTRITTSDLIRWSLQLARGMKYLGSKKIIHGDLAARNILLTGSRNVKIIDFGLAKKLKDGQSRYVKKSKSQYFTKKLPVDRLSPEYLRDEIFSTQSDVWAFGITLWEIFSLGEEPYAEFPKKWDYFQNKLSNGYRLPRPEYASPQIYSMMKKCWDENPDNRPTFENLVNFFEHLSVPANQQGQPTITETEPESRTPSVAIIPNGNGPRSFNQPSDAVTLPQAYNIMNLQPRATPVPQITEDQPTNLQNDYVPRNIFRQYDSPPALPHSQPFNIVHGYVSTYQLNKVPGLVQEVHYSPDRGYGSNDETQSV